MSVSSPQLSVSIVSHLQAAMVKELLGDLARFCHAYPLEVILTLNMPEPLDFELVGFRFPVVLQHNATPQGFGANHNQAFGLASGDFFCVLNPDIRFSANPFPALMACLADHSVGVAAPLVLNADGAIEDSARRFPTPLKIVCKALGVCRGIDYPISNCEILPDWVGGMCLLFRRAVYQQLGGFDQRYFLYYEDVNLCARLGLSGLKVVLSPKAWVVHHAQRTSRRKFKYLAWHVQSMLRFFLSPVFWQVMWRKARKALT
jgi:GT2 family glycosyltransferase